MTARALVVAFVILISAMPLAAQETGQQQPLRASEQLGVEMPERDTVRTTVKDGYPSVRIGGLRVDFHARVQADLNRSDRTVGDASDADLSRKRVGIEGEIGKRLSFELDAELGDDEPWRDAFADYRIANLLRVRGGQFKVPFSLDATTSAGQLDFVFRSQGAAQLAPERERGVMFHGRAWRRAFQYEAGVFVAESVKASSARAPIGRTMAVRITSRPFSRVQSSLGEFEGGVAYTVSDLDEGLTGLRGETALGQPLFEPIYWVRGERQRMGIQGRWEPGPFSLSAEYLRVSDTRKGQALSNTDLPALVARGWYASGTWLITGEDKASGNLPRRSVFRGGTGAVEAAVRFERLTFGDLAYRAPGFPNPRAERVPGARNQVITAGVNWYLHRAIKVQGNLVREVLDGVSGSPSGRLTGFSQVFRVQFAL